MRSQILSGGGGKLRTPTRTLFEFFVFNHNIVIASDIEQACSQLLLSTFIYGISKSTIPQELLIFEEWSMEQNIFVFDHSIDMRDEPNLSSSSLKDNFSEI